MRVKTSVCENNSQHLDWQQFLTLNSETELRNETLSVLNENFTSISYYILESLFDFHNKGICNQESFNKSLEKLIEILQRAIFINNIFYDLFYNAVNLLLLYKHGFT